MTDSGHSDRDTASGDLSPAAKRSFVRDHYGSIADSSDQSEEVSEDDAGGCCSPPSSDDSCCTDAEDAIDANALGYEPARIKSVPGTADLGLGCGNPTAIADLERGETVLDLGSGGGFDCFLAAEAVGSGGKAIGVDMTPKMIKRARRNAKRAPQSNVEFRLGEIEHLPVSDRSVDVVISNCVINLSPDKSQVFTEAYRVLKPGGRLAISDIVVSEGAHDKLDRTDLEQYAACLSGAATVPELRETIKAAGFDSVSVEPKAKSESIIAKMYDNESLSGLVHSANITGRKARPGSES